MIGGGSWCDLVTLPRATFDAVFAKGPGVIVAGAFNPAGSITPVNGAYRVEGRWGFASGCEHADWTFGNCVEGLVEGHPVLRAALFTPVTSSSRTHGPRPACARRRATTSGSRTSAFHPIGPSCRSRASPASTSPSPASTPPRSSRWWCRAWPSASPEERSRMCSLLPLARSRCSRRRRWRRTRCSSTTWPSPMRSCGRLAACCTRRPRRSGRRASTVDRCRSKRSRRTRASAAWATERATHVVDTAQRFGGGTAVYADSPLQRRLRDIHTLTQHFIVRPDTLTTAGAVLAGQEPDVPVF